MRNCWHYMLSIVVQGEWRFGACGRWLGKTFGVKAAYILPENFAKLTTKQPFHWSVVRWFGKTYLIGYKATLIDDVLRHTIRHEKGAMLQRLSDKTCSNEQLKSLGNELKLRKPAKYLPDARADECQRWKPAEAIFIGDKPLNGSAQRVFFF